MSIGSAQARSIAAALSGDWQGAQRHEPQVTQPCAYNCGTLALVADST
jgi:hypothetical protein